MTQKFIPRRGFCPWFFSDAVEFWGAAVPVRQLRIEDADFDVALSFAACPLPLRWASAFAASNRVTLTTIEWKTFSY
jgi:hypothetical protein